VTAVTEPLLLSASLGNVKDGWQRRIFRGLTSMLAAIWMVSVVASGSLANPSMPCHGMPMPCCPPSGSSAQCSVAQCSGAQCIEQIPQKAEMSAPLPALEATRIQQTFAVNWRAEAARELNSGLRFEPAVFRLKDDLRI
jgi:hypothetical protein